MSHIKSFDEYLITEDAEARKNKRNLKQMKRKVERSMVKGSNKAKRNEKDDETKKDIKQYTKQIKKCFPPGSKKCEKLKPKEEQKKPTKRVKPKQRVLYQKLSRKQLVNLLHEWATQFNPNQQVHPSIFPLVFKTKAKDFSQLTQLYNGKDDLYKTLTKYIITYRNKKYNNNFSIIDPKFPELGF